MFFLTYLCFLLQGTCIILHVSGGFPDNYTNDMKGTVLAYCSSLVFLDTIVNPIIYALKINTVKQKFVKIFRGCINNAKTHDISEVQCHILAPEVT